MIPTLCTVTLIFAIMQPHKTDHWSIPSFRIVLALHVTKMVKLVFKPELTNGFIIFNCATHWYEKPQGRNFCTCS